MLQRIISENNMWSQILLIVVVDEEFYFMIKINIKNNLDSNKLKCLRVTNKGLCCSFKEKFM